MVHIWCKIFWRLMIVTYLHAKYNLICPVVWRSVSLFKFQKPLRVIENSCNLYKLNFEIVITKMMNLLLSAGRFCKVLSRQILIITFTHHNYICLSSNLGLKYIIIIRYYFIDVSFVPAISAFWKLKNFESWIYTLQIFIVFLHSTS